MVISMCSVGALARPLLLPCPGLASSLVWHSDIITMTRLMIRLQQTKITAANYTDLGPVLRSNALPKFHRHQGGAFVSKHTQTYIHTYTHKKARSLAELTVGTALGTTSCTPVFYCAIRVTVASQCDGTRMSTKAPRPEAVLQTTLRAIKPTPDQPHVTG